jgi:hypothetical protein
MSDTPNNTPSQTQAADSVIATTPPPNNESWETQISRQLNSKPDIKKIDLKSLEDLPDSMAPTDMDYVAEQDANDYLKQMDGGTTDEPTKNSKKTKVVVKEEAIEVNDNSFDVSDLDLTKEPSPIVETKTKKSKEDNIAELRKKAEAYEESLKAKDTEVSSYREKLEKLEGELERTAFERSPKFKDKYEAPFASSVDAAKAFAEEFADDATIAEKALSLKGRERIEFIDESFGGGAAAGQFLSLVNDAEGKRGALEGALENYRATATEIDQAEQQHSLKIVEEVNTNFDRMTNHLAKKSDFFRMTGDDDNDKLVTQRIEAARAIIHGNATSNEMTVAPFLAVIAREAVAENDKLKAELAKYKSRAKEDAAVQPRISKGSSSDLDDDVIGKPKSALDSIRSQLRGY